MFRFAHCFIALEERECALQRLSKLQNQSGGSLVGVIPGAHEPKNDVPRMHGDNRKLAHNNHKNFKKDEKFSEKMWKHIPDFHSGYEEACLDYKFLVERITQHLDNTGCA